MLRAKGFLWLASRHDDLILFSIAGGTLSLEPQSHWLAVDPEEEQDQETSEYIRSVWQQPYGDRRQELVFIGAGMDRMELEARLNAALITEQEMAAGPETWAAFDDPFAEMFRDIEERQDGQEQHHNHRQFAVSH